MNFYDYEAEDAGFEILDFPCNQFGNRHLEQPRRSHLSATQNLELPLNFFPKLR